MSKPQTIDELMHHLKYENGIDIDGDEQKDQLICSINQSARFRIRTLMK